MNQLYLVLGQGCQRDVQSTCVSVVTGTCDAHDYALGEPAVTGA